MNNFESKSLKRTFDKIVFASSINVNGSLNSSTSASSADHTKVTTPVSVDLSNINKANGGKTVAEVFSERKQLDGKDVLVRGKVVKYMSGIMGKNWLHVKDGSGAPGYDDLVVTTSTQSKVGDLVLLEGKVSSDKDFGSGYKYDVIIEDAKVTVE